MNSAMVFLEQVLDVVHAVDVCHLQQFTDFCSTGVFFRASILSGHIFFLHPDASILHLSGGLHNYWDGLAEKHVGLHLEYHRAFVP